MHSNGTGVVYYMVYAEPPEINTNKKKLSYILLPVCSVWKAANSIKNFAHLQTWMLQEQKKVKMRTAEVALTELKTCFWVYVYRSFPVTEDRESSNMNVPYHIDMYW